MDWRWRGLSARPSLQRTSKASTKGAVKEAAMVKLPLLCPELVLQAMKVIFSGWQGKSADGWTSSLAQKSVGTYNWLTHIPRLSQHGTGCETQSTYRKIPHLFKTHLTVCIRAAPPIPPGLWVLLCLLLSCKCCVLQPVDSYWALLPVAVSAADITSIDFTQWEEENICRSSVLPLKSSAKLKSPLNHRRFVWVHFAVVLLALIEFVY